MKIAAGVDCCENKVKGESNIEFNLKDCCGNHVGSQCCGVKGHLNRITLFLSLLNKINLKETETGAVLSLDLKDFCKEACPANMGVDCCDDSLKCCGCDCFKEFLHHDYDEAMLSIKINSHSEIEKIEVIADSNDKKVKALVDLRW